MLLHKAMARRREDRFQTAKEFSETLVELLYRDNPRFTPSLLAQLVAHLFTEDLTAEGRKVELPPTFAEQLSAWQNPGPPASASKARISSPGKGTRTPGTGNRAALGSGRMSGRHAVGGGSKPPSEADARPASGSPG